MLSSTRRAVLSGGGTWPPGLSIGRSWSSPNPNCAAVRSRAPAGNRAPRAANAVLQLCAKAVVSDTGPSRARSWLWIVRPPRTTVCGQSTVHEGGPATECGEGLLGGGLHRQADRRPLPRLGPAAGPAGELRDRLLGGRVL